MNTQMSSYPSIYLSVYLQYQELLARSWRHEHEAELTGEEEKEQLFVAHQPVKSATFASSHACHLMLKHIHTLHLFCS